MKSLIYLLSFSYLALITVTSIHADEHGGVHIRIPTCEDANIENNEEIPGVCMELKPWYHHQHFDDYEDIEDQADRLQDDTTWPGQRQDFSDTLLR